ncbi:MAG: HEPN domain-containing protein [Planctomycetota bacterium]
MNRFAQVEWGRARRALAVAEQAVPVDPDSAASRAYYAAFHAVTALFALRGRSFKKHSALWAAVHRHLVNTREWPPELGRDYNSLLQLRAIGDYGGVANVSTDDAELALDKARSVLDAVRETCPELESTD